jgi:hypothetical protein
MTGSGRRGAVLTLALGVALSVTGCGTASSSSPHSLPPLAPAATQSATPTPPPSPSTTPLAPKIGEIAAVKAVVKRYYAIANNLHLDMDSRALASLFTPACKCQAQARAVHLAASKGEHYIDHAHINALRASGEGPRFAHVLADIDAARGGLETSDGRTVTYARPQDHVRRVFRLEEFRQGWLIYSIDVG